MPEGLKIQLGCGPQVMDGWENLDPRVELDPRIKGWRWNDPLPYPDCSADVVLVQHSSNHCSPDKFDDNFREIWRVLKPGGKVVIKDPDDRYYVWRRVGATSSDGTFLSTISLPKAIEMLGRNGFTDFVDDKAALVGKYGAAINRVRRLLRGNKLFIVEATKPA